MSMAKVSNVPSGFYNGKQAAERLGLKLATFYNQVKAGMIPKTIPPGAELKKKPEGYYDKKIIDEIAKERALYLLLHSIEPINFRRASSKEDIKGIVDVCLAIYGQGGTPSYDARLEIWQKNPEVYYLVEQEGIVTGYISLIWFDDEALSVLMGPSPKKTRFVSSAGSGIYSVTGPEHIKSFFEGQPIDSLFVSLGVRPGLINTEQREYTFKLIRGTQEVLVSFAERQMPVKKLLATSEKGDGIRMAKKLGMQEIIYPDDPVRRYELDIENSDSIFLHPYKQALEKYKQSHF